MYSSCANQGTPTGGPRDSIPPVLLKTEPEFASLNFKGNEIRFTFNEYIVNDKVMELLVVSPPLERRPVIKMKSKTLILAFNEELRDSVTYSVDFKNSIEDNNERNPLDNLRFAFSTWDVFDTLRIAGMVKNAMNLDPVENTLVMLYKNLHDSAVYTLIPDYIAKTDEKGIFMIGNIAHGKYNIFTINDTNSDLKYNEGVEEIAYFDTLIVPEVHFVEELDTIASGADSLLISGHYHFLPEPVYLRQFMEDLFSQFLSSANRISKNKCQFIFEESVQDTLGLNLVNSEIEDWYLLEANPTVDTISLWITDTLIANLDTIELELMYYQLDTAGQLYIQKDTIGLIFIEEEIETSKRKKRDKNDEEDIREDEIIPVPQFSITDNLKSNGFDLYKPILLTIPQPVKNFNFDQVHLYVQEDTTGTPLRFNITEDTTEWRRYRIDFNWAANTEYRFEIDSAAFENIYGITSKRLMKKFTTQKDDYYGAVLITTSNVNGNIILQLIKGNDEELVQEKTINSDGLVVFEYLPPEKYKLKAIYDTNKNGEWDTGSLIDCYQPEVIAYFQKVFKIKSNFDQEEKWDLTIDTTFPKNIYDADIEEQKRKEAEELRNNNNNNSNNLRNSISTGNSRNPGTSGAIRRQ